MVFANLRNLATGCSQKPIIVVVGPTASGKSLFAHQLFHALRERQIYSELVNLDAFQIYRGLNVGTAKPTQAEINEYHYHGVDIYPIHENSDSQAFANLSRIFCTQIHARQGIPICVGGSGLYLRAFLHELDTLPARNNAFRQKMRQIAEAHGWPHCHRMLSLVDPVRAAELHPNDKTRIERALEIYELTGKPMSVLRSKTEVLNQQQTIFPAFVIHIQRNSELLKQRIAERVAHFFAHGWMDEVLSLYQLYGNFLCYFTSLHAIGYHDILQEIVNSKGGLAKNSTLNDSLQQKITASTWQYARRQMTWYAKEKQDAVVTNPEDDYCIQTVCENIIQFLKHALTDAHD